MWNSILPCLSPTDVQIHEELLCFVLIPILCLCWRNIQSWFDFCPTLSTALNTLVVPAEPQKGTTGLILAVSDQNRDF